VGLFFALTPLVQDGARRQLQKLSYRFVDVREGGMRSKLMVLAVAGACVVLVGCNTVRGAAKDVESAANCTESTMKTGRC
jgi:predicted small secreted protein